MALAYAHNSPQQMIRLLVDGRKLGDGGIGVYIENLVLGLSARSDVTVTVISSHEKAASTPWREKVAWVHDESKPYSCREYFLLPRRIDWRAFDIYHSPHFTLPFGIPIPTVVTIHDLIHIEHPESFYYPLIARRLITSAVRRATALLAVSNSTKRAVQALTKVADDRISVIPNAVPAFLSTNALSEHTSLNVKKDVSEIPYMISVVSNLKPHKGVRDLLLAYREARITWLQSAPAAACPRLLLAGYGTEELARNRELSALATETDGVELRGAVTPAELGRLYQGARAVVIPSLAEGFCLPALEAQSLGVPVVCRPIAALKELVTTNDIVAEDTSWQSLSRALAQVVSEPHTQRVVDREHISRFALERVSQQLHEVYTEVLSHSSSSESVVRGVQ